MSNASQRIADLSPEERRALLAKLLRKEANESQSLQPLSYNQQGIWFLYQLAPESRVYNVNFAARIRSDVDIPALRRAFQALVDRHPALRTTFCVRSGKPAQRVHPHLAVHFVETDASAWDSEVLKTRLLEEAYRPFDLERGPVLRVNLFTCSANGSRSFAGSTSHRDRFLVPRAAPHRTRHAVSGGKGRRTSAAACA